MHVPCMAAPACAAQRRGWSPPQADAENTECARTGLALVTHACTRTSLEAGCGFIESPRARCTTSSVPGPDDRQRPRWQCRRTRRQQLDVLPARGPGCMHSELHACGARAAATAPHVCSRIGNQCSGVDGRIRKDPPACRPMRFWTCPIGDSTARHGCYRLWMIQHQCLWYKQKLC